MPTGAATALPGSRRSPAGTSNVWPRRWLSLRRRRSIWPGLARYDEVYAGIPRAFAAKFGFAALAEDDAELIEDVFALMHRAEVDMTWFFRGLAGIDAAGAGTAVLQDAFYREESVRPACRRFRRLAHALGRARAFGRRAAGGAVARMNAVNPRYVLRNYLAQQAIDRAEQGDPAMIHELLDVLRHPYDEQPGREAFAAKRPEWARHKAGCSMPESSRELTVNFSSVRGIYGQWQISIPLQNR